MVPAREVTAAPGEELFRLLVDSVSDYAIFLLDPDGFITSWNMGAERLKGYKSDEIIGQHFSIFYPPEAQASKWPQQELKSAAAEGRFEDEGWRIRQDGTRFWANVVITALRDKQGTLLGFAKVTRDLTERKIAETILRESEARYRRLVERVKDYAIFMLDAQGNILSWNAGAERLKGYKAAEIIGQHFSIFYPEALRATKWPEYELKMATQEGRFEDEAWRIRKDGSRFWANVVITALRDDNGELVGFSKVTRDMTERKQWEEQIQELNASLSQRVGELEQANRVIEDRTVILRNLSARLLTIQDDERRRIARELHESVSQELTAIKIMIDSVLLRGGLGDQTTKSLENGTLLAGRVLQSVRSLSHLLHPPLLDEAGLSSALSWFVQGFAERSNINATLDLRPRDFPRLSSEAETAVFRIVQESLANVYRHSGSAVANVEVEKHKTRVTIRVRDYGTGLPPDTEKRLSSSIGVGIGGMRERVRQSGGDLTIKPASPGTVLEAWLPLPS